jgi:ubiquinone/menaquinone biosynthesis C-methylase UbiE
MLPMMNVRDVKHALLPQASPEEESRQRTVVSLRRLLNGRVRPLNPGHYEAEGAPAFQAQTGRAPQSPDDVEAALFASPRYRVWSAMHRSAQELIWQSAGEPVVRDTARMEAAAQALIANPHKLGSLDLPADFVPPDEVAQVDIHLQPGGYALNRSDQDVLAGALYETGGNVFSFGQGQGKRESKAGASIGFLHSQLPDFAPKMIVDLGCSAGAATCAYADHYRDAEVHGVDLGAGMLRYAHARAESLGVPVHFHQMDAAQLRFADASFDLVVSHNLLHEIGRAKRKAMTREALRILKPGGVLLHLDVPIRFLTDMVAQVERGWDTRFNGEAFWDIYSHDDLQADLREAGFAEADITQSRTEKVDGPGGWYMLMGRKAA